MFFEHYNNLDLEPLPITGKQELGYAKRHKIQKKKETA